MKKKILALLLAIVMLASVFAGCSILSLNGERDHNQVVAEVNYKGMSSVVLKGELASYYLNNGGNYVQYYGLTAEETMTEFATLLAKRELLSLRAKEFLVNDYNAAHPNDQLDMTKMSWEDCYDKLMTAAEKKLVIDATNASFEEAFDKLVKELEDEQKPKDDADDDDDDDEKLDHEDKPTRPVPPSVDPEYDKHAQVEVPVKFSERNNATDIEKQAFEQIMNNVKSQYRDYDYFFRDQIKQQLLTMYKETYVGEPDMNEMIQKVYDDAIVKNKILYEGDQDAYESALKNGTVIVYHPYTGYGFVKNILFNFSDEQKALITNFTDSGVNNEDAINAYRWMISSQIRIKISNLKYDPEAECPIEDCTCVDCENYKGTEAKGCEVKNCPCPKCVNHVCTADDNDDKHHHHSYLKKDEVCPNHVCDNPQCILAPYLTEITDANGVKYTADSDMKYAYTDVMKMMEADLSKLSDPYAKIKAFEKWVYRVSDDTGMFDDNKNIKQYLITPDGRDSEYVEEFTALSRKLISEAGLGGYKVDLSDPTVAAEAKKDGYAVDAETGIAYCVTSYGIHIMMVSQIPYTGADAGAISLESIVNLVQQHDEDFTDNQYFFKTETLKEYFKDKIFTDLTYEVYSKEENAFFKEYQDSSISVNKGVLNQTINENKDVFKRQTR